MTPEQQPKPENVFPYQELRYSLDIEAMSMDDKLKWLAVDALNLEDKYLRKVHGLSQIKREGKIYFLTGGEHNDVTEAKDFENRPIHTRHLTKPKDPAPKLGEIPEALGAISRWFEEFGERRDRNLPPPSRVGPVSEVTDVIYCLANLTTLDSWDTETYMIYMKQIAESMGMPLNDLLTLTVIKYNYRLGQGKSQKNHMVEDQIMNSYLDRKNSDGSPKIPVPTNEQLHTTFHKLSEVNTLLNERANFLKQLKRWGVNLDE
jgi:hypothetical protein